MRLVVDTNVLVGEVLRADGRARLRDARLQLFLPEEMWAETRVEVPRRFAAFARRRSLAADVADRLRDDCLGAIGATTTVLDRAVYAAAEEEARARCVRDPDDWPVVASALALTAGVWTHDGDFLGTGVPTWTTATLQGWLERS